MCCTHLQIAKSTVGSHTGNHLKLTVADVGTGCKPSCNGSRHQKRLQVQVTWLSTLEAALGLAAPGEHSRSCLDGGPMVEDSESYHGLGCCSEHSRVQELAQASWWITP